MERAILFTGIGGQGIQLAAQILARAAVAEGRHALLFGSYGGTMRGGPTDSTLLVADAPVTGTPIVSRAWAGLGMHPSFFPAVAAKLEPGAVVCVNASLFEDGLAEPQIEPPWRVFSVEATRLASELGAGRAGSLLLLGAFANATALVSLDALVAAMDATLPARRREHRELNEAALRRGFEVTPHAVAPAWTSSERAA
ncbi:MAG: 2-oxoacid:acceptor oxidoreductase family protein [Myxococcota bacterium]